MNWRNRRKTSNKCNIKTRETFRKQFTTRKKDYINILTALSLLGSRFIYLLSETANESSNCISVSF